ncbi:hypothetical protein DN407_31240 (plasmid) [Bacillus sp. JAS24-2]|nr:hypothetical protein DN407_31240 [Bacillus sp. JAS24-2]
MKPATLRRAFIPTVPVDPLASLDIFGQQRFFIQEPHLTETVQFYSKLNIYFYICQPYSTK